MFTCVIPTLWKSNRIVKLVADLCACDSVGEVIIIDNAANDKLLSASIIYKYSIKPHAKLKIIPMKENIYVNPAWNLGVEIAKFDDIALVNDDIHFNADVFKIFDDGSLKNYGVIGMANENYSISCDRVYHLLKIPSHHYGWGCLILISKSNYIPIPDDLLIWCGDNWLSVKLPTFDLVGLKVDTEMSTTSGKLFIDVQHKDRDTFFRKYNAS